MDFLVLGVGVFLIAVALRLFRDMSVPWTPGSGVEAVSTDPGRLPYYAARTTLRMFLGLAASILFTLVVGQWAAHSRRAEKVLVPMVDVLQSVRTLPRELDDAARMLRLTRWQRLWQLEVPAAMVPLIWNGMMSFGGAWFMLAASEVITVSGRDEALPGMGSFIAAATAEGQVGRLLLAGEHEHTRRAA
ncbi:ABC transporter permease subunit [Nocardia tengchongensis]|uniref:ABC transporter permease subunit n=1 Tax=Nocardia tengchongensis TaxID=2055889 RepID=UPI0036933587